MTLDWQSLILLLGWTHGFYLVLVSFHSGRRLVANFFLSIILLVFSYDTFLGFLFSTYQMRYVPHLMGTSMPLLFLIGPAFYFFAEFRSFNRKSLKWGDLLHLIPFCLALVLAFPYYLKSGSDKLVYMNNPAANLPIERAWYMAAQWLTSLAYLLVVIGKLPTAGAKAEPWISRFNKVLWLLTIFYALVIPIFFGLTQFQSEIRTIILVCTSLFIHLLGLLMISQSTVFSVLGRPQKKVLDQSQMVKIKNDIESFMRNGQPWLKNDLSLRDLSDAIGSNSLYTSTVLNQEFGMNFNDYINDYRVEFAKKRLLGDEKMLAIAMESGFSNKSSFNRAFKKSTGLTPSEFRKNLVAI